MQHAILASVYAGPDAEYQLNSLSDGDAIDVFHYCDQKKRSFRSKMHQKPSGGRALPGPAGGA